MLCLVVLNYILVGSPDQSEPSQAISLGEATYDNAGERD